jgi:hypothetical protein
MLIGCMWAIVPGVLSTALLYIPCTCKIYISQIQPGVLLMNVKGNPYPYWNTKIYNKDSEVVEGKASMSACLQNKTTLWQHCDWIYWRWRWGRGGSRRGKGRQGWQGRRDWKQRWPVANNEVSTVIEPKEHNVKDSLENWTLTTTDWNKLDEIGHTIEKDDTQNSKVYKCKNCPLSSKAFNYAGKHYVNKHKNLTAEVDCLSSVQAKRSRILKNFDDLSKTGVNRTLVKHESTVTLGDLEALASELSNLPNNLPVHLDYKKKEFIKKLSEIVC